MWNFPWTEFLVYRILFSVRFNFEVGPAPVPSQRHQRKYEMFRVQHDFKVHWKEIKLGREWKACNQARRDCLYNCWEVLLWQQNITIYWQQGGQWGWPWPSLCPVNFTDLCNFSILNGRVAFRNTFPPLTTQQPTEMFSHVRQHCSFTSLSPQHRRE